MECTRFSRAVCNLCRVDNKAPYNVFTCLTFLTFTSKCQHRVKGVFHALCTCVMHKCVAAMRPVTDASIATRIALFCLFCGFLGIQTYNNNNYERETRLVCIIDQQQQQHGHQTPPFSFDKIYKYKSINNINLESISEKKKH